jgi:prepilin-type N-terminal cleavage/methylation domain-containing protein
MVNKGLKAASKKGGTMGMLGKRKGQRGFTLVELMVVMAIMAVLAAVVFPAVTGTTTTSREVSQSEDINNVQTAIDRFNADDTDGSPWASSASLTGVTTAWSAGELPTGSGATGSGTSGSPYVFTQDDVAGIDFASGGTVDGASVTFYPDYVRGKPDHSTDTISVGAGLTSSTFTIRKAGADVYVQLSNTTSATLSFPAWAIDPDGGVWVFVNASSY